MVREKFRHLLRVSHMPRHPQRQGLQALQDLKGGHGGHAGAEIANALLAGAVMNAAGAELLAEHQVMKAA